MGKVDLKCSKCDIIFSVEYKYRKRKYCSKSCSSKDRTDIKRSEQACLNIGKSK